jgi:succinate dehydrogenase flavin-adding protein (antitoxin of CptAB toxin-antitoxin module)
MVIGNYTISRLSQNYKNRQVIYEKIKQDEKKWFGSYEYDEDKKVQSYLEMLREINNDDFREMNICVKEFGQERKEKGLTDEEVEKYQEILNWRDKIIDERNLYGRELDKLNHQPKVISQCYQCKKDIDELDGCLPGTNNYLETENGEYFCSRACQRDYFAFDCDGCNRKVYNKKYAGVPVGVNTGAFSEA